MRWYTSLASGPSLGIFRRGRTSFAFEQAHLFRREPAAEPLHVLQHGSTLHTEHGANRYACPCGALLVLCCHIGSTVLQHPIWSTTFGASAANDQASERQQFFFNFGGVDIRTRMVRKSSLFFKSRPPPAACRGLRKHIIQPAVCAT